MDQRSKEKTWKSESEATTRKHESQAMIFWIRVPNSRKQTKIDIKKFTLNRKVSAQNRQQLSEQRHLNEWKKVGAQYMWWSRKGIVCLKLRVHKKPWLKYMRIFLSLTCSPEQLFCYNLKGSFLPHFPDTMETVQLTDILWTAS